MSWRFLAFMMACHGQQAKKKHPFMAPTPASAPRFCPAFRGQSWQGELSGKFDLETRHSELFFVFLFVYLAWFVLLRQDLAVLSWMAWYLLHNPE